MGSPRRACSDWQQAATGIARTKRQHNIMKRYKKFLGYIRRSRSLKYAVVLVAGVAFVGFIDKNSAWSHLRNVQRISELQAEIKSYRSQYERDKQQLHKLETDPKAIEKIARERYFMKMDDEDIFVLSDDRTDKTDNDNETTE